MPLSGDLGFHGPALFFLFAFFAVTFAIRRKWNAALARKEEIMRLVVLASEESARAELEAARDYMGSPAVVVRNQCAVCYCPTTTRCSRCKVVKYCSGKCQIMHWRQGHKEECCPPADTVQSNDLECYSDAKREQFLAEKSGFEDTSLDLEGGFRHEPLEKIPEGCTSPKSDCSSEVFCRKNDFEVKVKPLVDPTESHPSTVSPSTSSLTSDPDARVEVSFSRVPSSITFSRAISPLSNGTDSDVNQTKTMKPSSSESLSTLCPVDSSSNKLKPITPTQRSSNSSGSRLDSSVECTLDKPSMVAHKQVEATIGTSFSRAIDQKNTSRTDDEPLFQFSFNLSTQAVPSGTHASNNGCRSSPENEKPALFKETATDVPTLQGPSILSSERSCSMSGERRNNDRVLKSKQQRSLSFGDSAVLDQSSMVDRHSFSGVTSSVVKSVYSRPVCSSDITSPLNGNNVLMTSMRKVVQQFKTSKLVKHNNKVLFPYDSFVKLYNSEKVELRPFGLVNCGKSCYANAVLQCLIFTQPLIAYLLQGLHSKTCTKKAWCFTCEFERLILKAREQKSPLSPIGILTQINLGHGKEEDAHEFLRYAIDAMQSACLNEADADLLGPLEEETTLIQLIFGGYLKSKIKCMRCHGKSERSERMMDLNVEIHGNIGTLEEALAQFTSTEILDGDNKYKCSRCKSYEKAKKKLTILEAPNILTIALKRFQSGNFGKLNKSVRFPEMLDLTPYMSGTSDKPPLYKLYAVVVHLDVMNAAFSGHYVSYVKNVHGKWFKIDDSMVKYAELDRVLSQGAYMLFYARSSPHAPSLIKNLMSHDSKTRRTKCADPIPPSHPERNSSKARPNYDSSPAVHRRDDYPYESSDPFSGRFYPSHRIPKVDSSSDNSSLFSCSDEGSNSTDSTRDSTSTDDISDYIFGDSGRFSHYSPYRGLDDSEATSSSPFSRPSPLSVSSGSRHYSKEVSRGKGSSPSLYSDTTNHSRKLTDKYGSSSEIDREVLGWVNPSDINSGLTMRRPRDRTQAFY